MPYIGNTIRAADDYRLIDDISSGFNGSATSFALQVAGSAPVPFPKSPQQVLISVNGVIQEPDPTGASGFNLVGTNIVFSSAPTNGHAFFGIIYATADYLNAGGNFPSGSLGAPSITFIGDENTGYYRKGGGSVGFVSDATEIANFDSNGITISSGDLILGDNRKAKFGASDDLQIFHDGSNSFINEVGTGGLFIRAQNTFNVQKAGTSEFMIKATSDGSVELYHDDSKKFETTSTGVSVAGNVVATGNVSVNDNSFIYVGNSGDLSLKHDASNSFIINSPTGGFLHIRSNSGINLQDTDGNENFIKCIDNGAVELYHDNTKTFQTTANGIELPGSNSLFLGGKIDMPDNSSGSDGKILLGTGDDLQIYHDGTNSYVKNNTGVLYLQGDNIRFLNDAGNENIIKAFGNGAVELYHNGSKKFETNSAGVKVTGQLEADEIYLRDSEKILLGTGTDFEIYHNGTNAIVDNNTGVLSLQTTSNLELNIQSNFRVLTKGGSENCIQGITDGAVELYFDNAKKFSTESYGVSLHGLTLSTQNNILYYNSSTGQVSYQAPSGGVNTPAFFAYADGDQAQSNDSLTLLQADAEDFDVGGCYNTSNYRFTPNEAGKYVLYGQALVDAGSGNFTRARCGFRKNGSQLNETDLFLKIQSQTWHLATVTSFMIVVANGSSDYFEFFSRGRTYSGGNVNVRGGTDRQSYFAGYKLIE